MSKIRIIYNPRPPKKKVVSLSEFLGVVVGLSFLVFMVYLAVRFPTKRLDADGNPINQEEAAARARKDFREGMGVAWRLFKGSSGFVVSEVKRSLESANNKTPPDKPDETPPPTDQSTGVQHPTQSGNEPTQVLPTKNRRTLTLEAFLSTPTGRTLSFDCPKCGRGLQFAKPGTAAARCKYWTFPCQACNRPAAAFSFDEDGMASELQLSDGGVDVIVKRGGIARIRCPHCSATDQVCIAPHTQQKLLCKSCSRLLAYVACDENNQGRVLPHFFEGFKPRVPVGGWEDVWKSQLLGFHYTEAKRDRGDRFWQTSAYTWELKTGVCRDSAVLLADWLHAEGYNARVVVGQVQGSKWPGGGGSHAWVVIGDATSSKEYLLESTRVTQSFPLRTPPLAETMTDYFAEYQFQSDGYRGRTSTGWTGDYERGWYFTSKDLNPNTTPNN